MKKIKTFLLAFILLLGLTSCNSQGSTSNSQINSTITSTRKPTSNTTPTSIPTLPTTSVTTTPTSIPTLPTTSVTTKPTSIPTLPSTSVTTTPTSSTVIDDTSKTPTIYLAGDSTVKTYNDDQYIGEWGQFFDLYLDDSITVVNCAQGGRSSRSFINEGRLYDIEGCNYSFTQNNGKSIESVIKEGDFLFIQFGHNDDASKRDATYTTIFDRMVELGTADSNGKYPVTEATRTSTTILPLEYTSIANDSEETKALAEIAKYGATYYPYGSGSYKWFLKQYIDFAREKGATPVLVTPVARVKFSGDTIISGPGLHGDNFAYVQAVRQLAEEENCLLIDLFAESKTILETATSNYANYLMALKPNELVGTWPQDYDKTYGNTDLGYTGIEATHYNKYGAFLEAAKVVEAILSETNKYNNNTEYYNFTSNILTTPKSYVDPSNLMSKTIINNIEGLFTTVAVTNPNRVFPDPNNVITKITELEAKGEVTNDNYLEFQTICEEIRSSYISLNVDDRPLVTNLSKLEEYEAKVQEFVIANMPTPISVVTFNPTNLSVQTITSSVTYDGFTIVGTAAKPVDIKANTYSFKYNNNSYTTSNYVSLGGSATFGSYRYIEFATTGACKITVVAKSSGTTDRILNLVDTSGNKVASFDAKASHSITTADINNAGTYRLGSAGSGILVYYIIIEYFD